MCFTHTFWPQDQLPDYRGSLLGLVGLPTRGLALQFRLLVSFSIFFFHLRYIKLYTSLGRTIIFLRGRGMGNFQTKENQVLFAIILPIIIAMNDRTPEYLKGVFKSSSADYIDYIENKITMPKRRAVL